MTSVGQFLGRHPIDQSVVGLISSHGTYLDCELCPSLGTWTRQPIVVPLSHQCSSPSFSPSLILSLSLLKQKQKKKVLKRKC